MNGVREYCHTVREQSSDNLDYREEDVEKKSSLQAGCAVMMYVQRIAAVTVVVIMVAHSINIMEKTAPAKQSKQNRRGW